MEKLRSLIGMLLLLFIAWLLSKNRKRINYKTVIIGTLIQIIFAIIVLKTTIGYKFFLFMNDVIVRLLSFADEGSKFLFGNLIKNNIPIGTGAPGNGPFTPIIGQVANAGAFFAFSVLPTIIFFSSLMSVLYYLGVMQVIVTFFAKIMTKFMGTSGAESLSASANIFVGQTEAPLVIRPYVRDMTESELLAVMTGGMATVAGGVMAAYVGMLKPYLPNIAGHLLSASIMSAPAALVMAKLMIPETQKPLTAGVVKVHYEKVSVNVIDAAARGAADGLKLALNVGAMLLAFLALIALLNSIVGGIGSLINTIFGTNMHLTMEKILGYFFAPISWIMGVSWNESFSIGQLLGQKIILNEFVAYFNLSQMLNSQTVTISPRSIVIASYALCGFANFSSIAIQIGGIGGIAPTRIKDLAKLGIKSIIAGTLAAFMTATIAGILVG